MVSEDMATLGDGHMADISGLFLPRLYILAILPTPYIMVITDDDYSLNPLVVGESAAEASDDPDSEPPSSSGDGQPPPSKRQKTQRIGNIIIVFSRISVAIFDRN